MPLEREERPNPDPNPNPNLQREGGHAAGEGGKSAVGSDEAVDLQQAQHVLMGGHAAAVGVTKLGQVVVVATGSVEGREHEQGEAAVGKHRELHTRYEPAQTDQALHQEG